MEQLAIKINQHRAYFMIRLHEFRGIYFWQSVYHHGVVLLSW